MTAPAFQASAQVSSSGNVAFYGGATLTAVYAVATATGGSVTLREGGASGTIRLQFDTPAAAGPVWLPIPGKGLPFDDDVFCQFSNVTSITVFREAS